ncbi:DUF2029 domain-containing protein [Mucilaginibacter sp. RS28]|uniref:DUF2029 domain-containing protein n=1 Tax=Mucilaginibacter straminoryzae TaxID=2932774 RepID=A0A9X2BCU3_9SPHI|nr:glycosyltransferase family 87 protein [Mucilaginibacter straminoryzae]MCJ8209643.1 DUF2029 domain-containing protein [Mucilaginibacter straminoryzae]
MSKLEKLLLNKYVVLSLWFGLSLIAVIKQASHNHINNYFIYKYTFVNLIHQHNLYSLQPEYYFDLNHYGPLFGLVIAPFTLLPDFWGCVLWVVFNCFALYWAIWQLPMTVNQRLAILLISAHELMTAAFGVQFNPSVAAIIILSLVFVHRKQDMWATLLIVAGTLIKLYGIVGLAFFFFSKNKIKFIWTFLMWSAVLFVLPMAFSSPHFVIQSYHDWLVCLSQKNADNTTSHMQDISVMGMIRRIFHYPQLSNLAVLIPGVLLFASAYIRISQFKYLPYRLTLLASVLIFAVIFSTGSESPTYIIAFAGVAIWFMNLDRPVTGFVIFLLVFALLVTSLSPSDLFPKYINKTYIKPYALKAFPCFLIWLKITYELLTKNFGDKAVKAVAS